MDYEKLYKEALERTKYFMGTRGVSPNEDPFEVAKELSETAFPELKEFEGESIRKRLIELLKNNDEQYYAKEIAWLEKQGKQKTVEWSEEDLICLGYLADFVDKNGDDFYGKNKPNVVKWIRSFVELPTHIPINEIEQKPVDKVEPKFKVDDYIIDVQGVETNKIVGYEDDSYLIRTSCSQFYLPMKLTEKNYRLWSIADAKDGDVLKEDSCVFIIEKMNHNGTAIVHCCLFDDGEFALTGSTLGFDVDSTHPATKEQRDLLFQKMKEAGYEWDAEKLELKEIEQELAEWSEEDEENLNWFEKFFRAESVISEGKDIPQDRYLWFKNLKGRVQPQPKQEWSEEDERMYKAISIALTLKDAKRYLSTWYKTPEEADCWLKSLKEKYTWKPSDEHYELEEFAKIVRSNLTGISKAVQELFEAKYLQLTGRKMYGGFKD